MKKVRKQILMMLLILSLAFSCMCGFSVSAAEAKVVIYHSFDYYDSIDNRVPDWNTVNDEEILNVIEGKGSLYSVAKPDLQQFGGGFLYMILVDRSEQVDLNETPYFEVAVKCIGAEPFNDIVQVNFASQSSTGATDSDGNPVGWGEDGKNIPNEYVISTDGKWRTFRLNALEAEYSVDYPTYYPELVNKVDRLRFSIVSETNTTVPEGTKLYLDGMVFFNQEYLDERTVEEARVGEMIASVTANTSVEDVRNVANELFEGRSKYVNFLPKGWEDFLSVNEFVVVEKIMKELIAFVGNKPELTHKNAIEDFKEAYDALDEEQKSKLDEELLGQAGDVVEAVEHLAETVALAREVDSMIKAIGSKITLEKQAQIEAARAAYEALEDEAKDRVNRLDDLIKAEEELALLVEESKTVYGDLDGDGEVKAADALAVLQAAVGKITLSDESLQKAADVNGDGNIKAEDALLVLQFAVGKTDGFPVQNIK